MATSSTSEPGDASECSKPGSSSASVSDVVPSLLDRLRAPSQSEIMRKRKVRLNRPPHTGARKKKPACSTDPISVSVVQRVREFPRKMLIDSAGKLFCSACREELSLKLSIVKNHIESAKHSRHKTLVKEKRSREQDIAQAFQMYEQEVHPVGESLPEAHKLWRVKVVTTFLKAGVPLGKIELFRNLLEENAYSLSDRRGMSDLIPFIQAEEQQQIKAELQGKKVSFVFDGTTRLGEALVIVLRFVDDFVIQQRLVRFITLTKSLTGEEIARELINVLSVEYGISSERVLASMRDRASSNGVAMRTLRVVYPNLIDIGCYSHTIDLVGEKFCTPNLDTFIRLWVSLFAHSPRARLWWKNRTGKAMSSYSPTRWWSKWEVMSQVMAFFGDVTPFLQGNPEMSPATNQKLLEILLTPTTKAFLQVELAAVVDAGESFVKATYILEGDGPLALTCFEVLSTLNAGIRVGHYPNVQAIAQELSGGTPAVLQQWVDYAKACVRPGLQYFVDKFTQELGGTVAAFKAARLFLPAKVVELNPDAAAVDSLQAFPFFDASVIAALKSELPSYLAKAADSDAGFDPLQWWKNHTADLPHWSAAAAAAVILVQPSSAAAERIFSLLKASFGPQQDATLNDYIQTSLMLQYNR